MRRVVRHTVTQCFRFPLDHICRPMRRAAECWQTAFVLAAGGLALSAATFHVIVEQGLRRKVLQHRVELCLASPSRPAWWLNLPRRGRVGQDDAGKRWQLQTGNAFYPGWVRLREEMSLSGVEPIFDEARPLCVLNLNLYKFMLT